ncbi:hypothetical protein HMPREF1986_01674 [Oribacterium sp. oral taxon 078 str. F0263]|nr:hypothetical protein HMPREF1986_01674 [Oribacterium sp. oral taxon 078 str. F0263]
MLCTPALRDAMTAGTVRVRNFASSKSHDGSSVRGDPGFDSTCL